LGPRQARVRRQLRRLSWCRSWQHQPVGDEQNCGGCKQQRCRSLDAAPSSITPPATNANLRVESLLANDGKEPLVPSGVVALIDATGKLAAKSLIPAQRLLPGERLPFVVELPARPAPGRYKALSTFSFEGRTVTTSSDFTLP